MCCITGWRSLDPHINSLTARWWLRIAARSTCRMRGKCLPGSSGGQLIHLEWLPACLVGGSEGFWSTGSLIPFNRSMQWNVAVMQALQTLAKRPLFLISCTRIYCSFPGWTSQHINLLGTQPFYRWMQPRNLQYCRFFSSTFVNTRHEFESRPPHCPEQLFYARVILIEKSLKF